MFTTIKSFSENVTRKKYNPRYYNHCIFNFLQLASQGSFTGISDLNSHGLSSCAENRLCLVIQFRCARNFVLSCFFEVWRNTAPSLQRQKGRFCFHVRASDCVISDRTWMPHSCQNVHDKFFWLRWRKASLNCCWVYTLFLSDRSLNVTYVAPTRTGKTKRRRRHFGLTTSEHWRIFRQSVPPNYRKWHQRTLLLSDDLIRRKWSWSRQLIHRRKKLKRGGRGWQNLIDIRVLDTFVLRIQTATSYETLSREGDGAVVTGKRHYEPCSRCCFLSRFAWLRCRLPTVSIAGSLWGWSIGFFPFTSVFFFNPLCFFFFACYSPPRRKTVRAGRCLLALAKHN